MEKFLMHLSRRRLQNNSHLPDSLIKALGRLKTECIKAIFEARMKDIISCPRCNGSTTSAAIDRKEMGKSN